MALFSSQNIYLKCFYNLVLDEKFRLNGPMWMVELQSLFILNFANRIELIIEKCTGEESAKGNMFNAFNYVIHTVNCRSSSHQCQWWHSSNSPTSIPSAFIRSIIINVFFVEWILRIIEENGTVLFVAPPPSSICCNSFYYCKFIFNFKFSQNFYSHGNK